MQSSEDKTVQSMRYQNSRIVFLIQGNMIGKGGNGKVFRIKILEGKETLKRDWPDVNTDKLVAKFFYQNERKNLEERRRRYKRFCVEIREQERLCKQISGIIPVIEHSAFEGNKEEEAWYIMPEAKAYSSIKAYGMTEKDMLLQKLKHMLELAEIIRQMHEIGVRHRDIKPDNIFFYKNRIYLGDFGLVWTADRERMTDFGERLGPIRILPPEFESMEEIKGFDHGPSDVYLFIKVLWMVVKNDINGFRGEYKRGMSQIYLDKDKFDVETLEPLHLLLERGTKDKWKERLTIEECIEEIKNQINVCEKRLAEQKVRDYIYQEELAYFLTVTPPDRKIYDGETDILKCLDAMMGYCKLIIKNESEGYEIYPSSVHREKENVFLFTEKIAEQNAKKYLMHIKRLEIGKDSVVFYTESFTVENENYLSASVLNRMQYRVETKIAFDGTYIVKMMRRSF